MVSFPSTKRGVSIFTSNPKFIVGLIAALIASPILFYSLYIARALGGGGRKKHNDVIFVLSLQGVPGADPRNEGRLDLFKQRWGESCDAAPHVIQCHGVPDDRRGYGITLSLLHCLEKARMMDFEVSMIFEDDARLFDRESSLTFCDAKQRKSRVWSSLPEDALIAFLGGHSWQYPEIGEGNGVANSFVPSKPVQFLETTFSYGTYGFAVPRKSLDLLLETINGDLAHGFVDENGLTQTEFLSPERSWYRTAPYLDKKIYAIHPLVVWHEGGFSNTWKKNRESITGEEVNNTGGIGGV